MAILTPLSLDEARAIGRLYDLEVERVTGILGGSVNSNFDLACSDGRRVFLRVYEAQRAETATREAVLLEHLSGGGVVTPAPLHLAEGGGFISEHAGKPVAIFPWIEGEILCQRRVSVESARAVGVALARLHAAGESFDAKPASRFDVPTLRARAARMIERPELSDELRSVLAHVDAQLELLSARTVEPPCLAHADLFRDNILWKNGAITALIDFESACCESTTFDLMVTLLSWCFGDWLEPALARAMVAGYASIRPLVADERARLYGDARFAALRFTLTRIEDFELRPRGTGVFKDYRRFLARLAAVEAIGAKRFPTFLGL